MYKWKWVILGFLGFLYCLFSQTVCGYEKRLYLWGMKKSNIAVNVQGTETAKASNLTEMAALMAQFAAQNPKIMKAILDVQNPATKEPTKAKEGQFATFKGINISGAYTSKSGKKTSFLVYGEGTKAIKDVLQSIPGLKRKPFFNKFNVKNAGLNAPFDLMPAWNFDLSDLAKVQKALK